jgi:arsenite methyltransferase
MKEKDIKTVVKEKYGQIAVQSDESAGTGCCCGPSSSCCGSGYTVFSESYETLDGYNADADLGLGCGIPTDYAGIKSGDSVLDLGSGAGNDCFVARALVGEAGNVTGLDFTNEMVEKARKNASKLGFGNVKFVTGDIEEMPLSDSAFDVVISNCVLNLVPDKRKAFSEIMRVLKHGGHFSVSDVVIKGDLPDKLKEDAEMYAGCVSGAVQIDEYLDLIEGAGFKDIKIQKQRIIELPDALLGNYLSGKEIETFRKGDTGIISITVTAYK